MTLDEKEQLEAMLVALGAWGRSRGRDLLGRGSSAWQEYIWHIPGGRDIQVLLTQKIEGGDWFACVMVWSKVLHTKRSVREKGSEHDGVDETIDAILKIKTQTWEAKSHDHTERK